MWYACAAVRELEKVGSSGTALGASIGCSTRVSDVDIPVDTGDFRLLSRKAVDAMKQLNERNRYMKGLFAWIWLAHLHH